MTIDVLFTRNPNPHQNSMAHVGNDCPSLTQTFHLTTNCIRMHCGGVDVCTQIGQPIGWRGFESRAGREFRKLEVIVVYNGFCRSET
jgi:hypothetical protein